MILNPSFLSQTHEKLLPGSTTLQTEFYAPSGGPGGGSASGILIEKSGSSAPSGYQKVVSDEKLEFYVDMVQLIFIF